MKKLIIWILILGVAGFIAYNHFNAPLSEEENEVKQLENRFSRATRAFVGAMRMAGGTGLDTTSDIDDAIASIKKVRKELKRLKDRLTEEASIERAEKLEVRINEFYKKNDLD